MQHNILKLNEGDGYKTGMITAVIFCIVGVIYGPKNLCIFSNDAFVLECVL